MACISQEQVSGGPHPLKWKEKVFPRSPLRSCSLSVLWSPPVQWLSRTKKTAVKVREASAGGGLTSALVGQGLPPGPSWGGGGSTENSDTVSAPSVRRHWRVISRGQGPAGGQCVCSLSMKTLCNPFPPARPRGVLPCTDQMARRSGCLLDPMTLNRQPGTREHTGQTTAEPFFNFLPLTSACPQTARGSGMAPGVLEVPVCGTWVVGGGRWVDHSKLQNRSPFLFEEGKPNPSALLSPPLLDCG